MVRQIGLFVGLVTLDLIYLVERVPASNQKIVALAEAIAAGGPATNAAVTFRYLGDRSQLLSVAGQHPLSGIIRTDLEQVGVELLDLEPERRTAPPTSSILVTQGTGDRAVISLNAVRSQANSQQIPPAVLMALQQQEVSVVLVDGHQMEVAEAIARQARASGIPVVMDGGSWKPGFERVLPWVDYAICSSNFQPPGCQSRREIWEYLRSLGVPHIAITQGGQPIDYCSGEERGSIAVPQIQAVDTLGAGDVFHGAFCHFILRQNFREAIDRSAQVAVQSCLSFGTRQWMQDLPGYG